MIDNVLNIVSHLTGKVLSVQGFGIVFSSLKG